jgi:hypothetical protein
VQSENNGIVHYTCIYYLIEGLRTYIISRILEFNIDFEDMGKFRLPERAVGTGLFLEQALKNYDIVY